MICIKFWRGASRCGIRHGNDDQVEGSSGAKKGFLALSKTIVGPKTAGKHSFIALVT